MVLTSFDVNLASNLLEINLNGANLLYTISITSQMTMTRVSYTVISLNNSALSSSGITYLTNLFSFQSNQILTFPSSMTNIDQICLVGFFSLTSFSPSFSIRSQIVSNNFTFTSSTNYFQYLKYFCLGQCNVPR